MTQQITQTEMVHWMGSDGHARIKERPSLNWSRVNTLVCDQHSGNMKVKLKNFQLFETVVSGSQTAQLDTNLEHKSQSEASVQTECVQFQSGNVDVEFHMEGNAIYHQLLLDDSFFRDA